jgi:hypothetical protein
MSPDDYPSMKSETSLGGGFEKSLPERPAESAAPTAPSTPEVTALSSNAAKASGAAEVVGAAVAEKGSGGGGKEGDGTGNKEAVNPERLYKNLSYIELRRKLKEATKQEDIDAFKDEKFFRAIEVGGAEFTNLDQDFLEERIREVLRVSDIDSVDNNLDALANQMENLAKGREDYKKDSRLKGVVYDVVRGEVDAVRIEIHKGMSGEQLRVRGIDRGSLGEQEAELKNTRLGLANIRLPAAILQEELLEDELDEYAARNVPGAEVARRRRKAERLLREEEEKRRQAQQPPEKPPEAPPAGGGTELPQDPEERRRVIRMSLRDIETTGTITSQETMSMVKALRKLAEEGDFEQGLKDEIIDRLTVWRVGKAVDRFKPDPSKTGDALQELTADDRLEMNELVAGRLLRVGETNGLNVAKAWDLWQEVNNPQRYAEIRTKLKIPLKENSLEMTYFVDSATNKKEVMQHYLLVKMMEERAGDEGGVLARDSLTVAWNLAEAVGETSVWDLRADALNDKAAQWIHFGPWREKKKERGCGPMTTLKYIPGFWGSWFRTGLEYENGNILAAGNIAARTHDLVEGKSFGAYWVNVGRAQKVHENLMKVDYKPNDVTDLTLGNLHYELGKVDGKEEKHLRTLWVRGFLEVIATGFGTKPDLGWGVRDFDRVKKLLTQTDLFRQAEGEEREEAEGYFMTEEEFSEEVRVLATKTEDGKFNPRDEILSGEIWRKNQATVKPATDAVTPALKTGAGELWKHVKKSISW